jgi:hypothetical protein
MSGRKVYLIPGRDETIPRKGIDNYPCPRKSGCNLRKSAFHISPSELRKAASAGKKPSFSSAAIHEDSHWG